MKKLFCLIIFVFVAVNVHAQWLLFYNQTCVHCLETIETIETLDSNLTNKIIKLDLEFPTNFHRYQAEAELRSETNVWPRKIPVLMTDSNIFRGPKIILDFISKPHEFRNETFRKATHPSTNVPLHPAYAGSEISRGEFAYVKSFDSKDDNYNSQNKMKLKMFSVGLLDGINPCAFALMIFVCAALRLAGRRGKTLFLGAIIFVFAVAATYFIFGWGLLHGLRVFMTTSLVRATVYFLISIFTFSAAIIAIINIFKNRIILGVPEKWRRWLQKSFRKNVRTGTGLFIIAAMGIVAASVESVCTGQVYLPALLMLEREHGNTFMALWILFLYNLGFIITLTFVAIGAVLGLKTTQLEKWGAKQMKWANAILSLLFLIFAIMMFVWSFQEFSRFKKSKNISVVACCCKATKKSPLEISEPAYAGWGGTTVPGCVSSENLFLSTPFYFRK